MGTEVLRLQELANQEASRRNHEVIARALRTSVVPSYIRAPYIPIDLAQWKMMSPEAQQRLIFRMRAQGYNCLSALLQVLMEAKAGVVDDLVAVHGKDIVDRSGPPYCWKCDEIPCKCYMKYAYDSYCDLHRRLSCPTCA